MGVLKTLGETDIDAVVDCYNNANMLFEPANRPNATKYDFLGIFKSNIMLGYFDGVLRGFIAYKADNKVGYITSLYVDLNAGRRGIGSELTNSVIGIFKDMDVQICIVDCLKNADWALSFYRKICFKIYDAQNTEIDNPAALSYFKEKEASTWSVRMYKLLT